MPRVSMNTIFMGGAKLLSVTIFFMVGVILSGCQQQLENKPDIEIIDPWLRMMPPSTSSTAGFMTIKNNTDKPLILKEVSLDWARHAMLHESKVVDGMAKMNHLDEWVIEEQVEFMPGGKHIMIMGMKNDLKIGQTYNILLHFAGREPLEVSFKVRHAK